MHLFLNLLLRGVLLVAGLVFALSLACAALVLVAGWGLRAAWYRLTGRAVPPFVVRMGPRHAFEEMMRRGAPAASRRPRADSGFGARRPIGDVTDVEAK